MTKLSKEKNPERVVRGKINYDAGRAFEGKVANKLRNSNCVWVIHSDGSFGLWDLVGRTTDGRYRLVTCKTNGYLSPYERKQIMKYMLEEQKENEIIELWAYRNKKHMKRHIITLDDVRC